MQFQAKSKKNWNCYIFYRVNKINTKIEETLKTISSPWRVVLETGYQNPRWRLAAILKKKHKSSYLGCPLRHLDQIWYGDRYGSAVTSAEVKFHFQESKIAAAAIFKIHFNGLPSRFAYIHTKFGSDTKAALWKQKCLQISLCENPRWRRRRLFFTPRARYVPNVAKRSIWDQCKKKYILRIDRPTGDQPTTSHLENFKWPYLREGSSDPLHVWFYGGVFGVGGSNGAISGFAKFNRYVGENNARGVIRLVTI